MFMTITSWTECLEAECNFFDIKAFEVNYNIRHSMHHIHQIHHDINPSWMNDTQAWMDAIHFYLSNLYFNLLPTNWTWVPSQASLSSSSIRIFLCFIFISNISYFHFHSNIFIYIHHIHPHSSTLCLSWMKCKLVPYIEGCSLLWMTFNKSIGSSIHHGWITFKHGWMPSIM